jgi:hypothetical protein
MTRFSVSRRGLLQAAGVAAPPGLIAPVCSPATGWRLRDPFLAWQKGLVQW